MSRDHDRYTMAGQAEPLDRKARAKLEDKRRMAWRRAVESYNETRRLQQELSDFPELAGEPFGPGGRRGDDARQRLRA